MKAKALQVVFPVFVVASLFAVYQLSFDTAVASQHEQSETSQQASEKEMMNCQMMMEKKQEMMSMMKESMQQLESKLEEMKNAQGDQKVEKMAAVVAQLAEQHLTMHEKMMKMHEDGMGHMMGHMDKENKQSMMQCPMMKKMMGDENQHDSEHQHN